jgi:hypothetical protein
MTGSLPGGDAPSVRISGVTRGDDGLQARLVFGTPRFLEVPTTEPKGRLTTFEIVVNLRTTRAPTR